MGVRGYAGRSVKVGSIFVVFKSSHDPLVTWLGVTVLSESTLVCGYCQLFSLSRCASDKYTGGSLALAWWHDVVQVPIYS